MSVLRRAWTLAAAVAVMLPGVVTLAAAEEPDSAEAEAGRHYSSLFVGVTSEGGHSTGTIGLDYSYELLPWVYAGVLFDYAGGSRRSTFVAVGAYFRPTPRLVIVTAPGVEHIRGESEFAFRLGFAWDFEVGKKLLLAPAINFDFTQEETVVVWGLNIGRRFGRR